MSEFSHLPTPLHLLEFLSNELGVELWAKRDDLICEFLGGNKVRKMRYILAEWLREGELPDVVITNGGKNSNHARAVAFQAARFGIHVCVVLHEDAQLSGSKSSNTNHRLLTMAQSEVHLVKVESIAQTIERLKTVYEAKGLRVSVIPGGGHCPAGVEAYADAFAELPFAPDYIVHASGTGGTQAGLLSGIARAGVSTEVLGISVARNTQRGRDAIQSLLPGDLHGKVHFFEDYRFGGYEQFTPALIDVIKRVLHREGLPLDPTYTGKAMFALFDLVKQEVIRSDSKVVFWHTGGWLNLTQFVNDI